MTDFLREARDLRQELEGVEGYLRTDTAARVNELIERVKQELPEARVLAAIGPASQMPAARAHSPALDPSFSDLRGESGAGRARASRGRLRGSLPARARP